jgi:hypothetical protein
MDNGLADFMTRLRKFDNKNSTLIQYVEFENDDIQRSPTVEHVLEIYDKKPEEKKPEDKKPEPKKTIIQELKDNDETMKNKNRQDNNDAAMIPSKYYRDVGHYRDIGYI